jgi:phasin family protein
MAEPKEQFNEIQRRNMEAAMRLAQLAIDNAQRVMALQSELAQKLLTDSLASARAQTEARDGQEVFALRASYAKETAEQLVQTASRMAEIGNEARVEFSRLLTEQLASGNKEMSEAMQGFLKSMPGSNAQMLDAVKLAMGNANKAMEQITQASATAMEQLSQATKGAGKARK